jgi:GH15 family glucan-1,4-alpha-glucosidase
MLWGLHSLGFEWEANDYFYFMQDAAQADDLQVMYGIAGERELPEETLDHLSGYDNARPVRIGNGAYNQRQHDVWGTMLDSIFLHAKSRDHLPERRWPLIERLVENAIANWEKPDRGIWEVRGEPRHFLSSKVMCWVACDRGARLARLREQHEHAEKWQLKADEIKADILERGSCASCRRRTTASAGP